MYVGVLGRTLNGNIDYCIIIFFVLYFGLNGINISYIIVKSNADANNVFNVFYINKRTFVEVVLGSQNHPKIKLIIFFNFKIKMYTWYMGKYDFFTWLTSLLDKNINLNSIEITGSIIMSFLRCLQKNVYTHIWYLKFALKKLLRKGSNLKKIQNLQ